MPQIEKLADFQMMLRVLELLCVGVVPQSDERDSRIIEKTPEKFRNVDGVSQLKYDATAADAELESRSRLEITGIAVWGPLDAKSDN